MFKICVIGAGQMGSRHLQGLARDMETSQVFVVDKSLNSLDRAKALVEETSRYPPTWQYLQNFISIPKQIDLTIIATDSRNRPLIVEEY